MTARGLDSRQAKCACGAVELLLRGSPIVSVACYCDTCQVGARRIEALPDAPPVCAPDGGTEYVTYRKDRVSYAKGRELLKDYALEKNPKTIRVVASCCNSAMMMRFDDPRHWIPVYRARLGPSADPIEMRICTGFAPDTNAIPTDVPSHRDYPPALLGKLLTSRIAMFLRS